jgi:hypothetical protein
VSILNFQFRMLQCSTNNSAGRNYWCRRGDLNAHCAESADSNQSPVRQPLASKSPTGTTRKPFGTFLEPKIQCSSSTRFRIFYFRLTKFPAKPVNRKSQMGQNFPGGKFWCRRGDLNPHRAKGTESDPRPQTTLRIEIPNGIPCVNYWCRRGDLNPHGVTPTTP